MNLKQQQIVVDFLGWLKKKSLLEQKTAWNKHQTPGAKPCMKI